MKPTERIQNYEGNNRSNRKLHFLIDRPRFVYLKNSSALQDL